MNNIFLMKMQITVHLALINYQRINMQLEKCKNYYKIFNKKFTNIIRIIGILRRIVGVCGIIWTSLFKRAN